MVKHKADFSITNDKDDGNDYFEKLKTWALPHPVELSFDPERGYLIIGLYGSWP